MNPSIPLPPANNSRFLALDIFRGVTIFCMIMVNVPGIETHIYEPLEHAHWNGITPTDFIFPSFVFIVGVSVVLAYSKQLEKGIAKKKMIGKIFRRAIILFILGMLLSIFPHFDFSKIRVPGVLQRISIVFVCCSLLFLYTSWKFQATVGAAILVLYFLAMTLIPVPGYGYAILEPGKNLAAWVDSFVIPGRMWQGSWDPEGVLTTFPAIVTGITGMMAGHVLISNQTQERKINILFFAGCISFAVANIWDWFFPINKNLWTSSFVLYTSGIAAMILASVSFMTDILGRKKWGKFGMIYGSNAITAYVMADVIQAILFAHWGSGTNSWTLNSVSIKGLLTLGLVPEMASWLWSICFSLLCFIPIYFLYKKKIFIKI